MENDILDSLNDLGYEGPLADEVAFSKALDGGPKSLEYTKLVHILAEELKNLCNVEETVNIMNDPDDSSSFLLELSSFLKELGCPYKKLVTGHMSSRLQSKEDRILLLDYLVSELMAARMVSIDCPKEKPGSGMEIVVQESPTAKDLKDILITLKFNKPPPNITPEILFSKLQAKLKDTIQKEGDQLVGKPLYNKALSEKDWKNLETAFTEMFEEYRLRRETLITRLECTIQSFEWSDRLKVKKDHIQSAYRPKRENLKVKPDVRFSDFLAARTSLLLVEKTSSASVRKNTQSEVNKVLIGRVPDRGGRPNEQQPPPPEMPSWQQRSAPQGGGGRGGGGGGRGGGGVAAAAGAGAAGAECKAATTRPTIRDHKQARPVTKTRATTKPTKCHRVDTSNRNRNQPATSRRRASTVTTVVAATATRAAIAATRAILATRDIAATRFTTALVVTVKAIIREVAVATRARAEGTTGRAKGEGTNPAGGTKTSTTTATGAAAVAIAAAADVDTRTPPDRRHR